jgi:hypothetical protein
MKTCRLAALSVGACLLALQGGCLAVAIGALAYDEGKYKEERQAFNAQNIEREKAGLKPLTWEEWRKNGAAK